MDQIGKNASESAPAQSTCNVSLFPTRGLDKALSTGPTAQAQEDNQASLNIIQRSPPSIQKIFDLNSQLHIESSTVNKKRKNTFNGKPNKSSLGLLAKLNKEPLNTNNDPTSSRNLLSPRQDNAESSCEPSSNRSCSTPRQLFNFFGSKQKAPQLSVAKNPTDEEDALIDDGINFELDNVLIEFPFGIISPYGHFKRKWDIIMAILLAYVITILSVRLCFRPNPRMTGFAELRAYESDWLLLDLLVDGLLIIDIVVNFMSAYENVAGMLYSNRVVIAKRYMKGWFVVDILSIFPANIAIFNVPFTNLDTNVDLYEYRAWRIIRLIKLIRVFKLFDTIERMFSLLTLNADKMIVMKSCCLILTFIHVMGCVWNLVAELEVKWSWYDVEHDEELTILERYVTSVYFGVTVLLTVGYGNIHSVDTLERIMIIIWMFYGIILYTFVFNSITLSLAKLNQTQTADEAKDLFYRDWTKAFKLPYETLDSVVNTIGGAASSHNTKKMEAIHLVTKVVDGLPKVLYAELYNHIFKELIEKVEFFKTRPRHFLIKFILLLKQTNFEPGDTIYSTLDPALEVFFIVKGRVWSKVPGKFEKEKFHIHVEGSLFGEVDILLKRNRISTVIAEEKCELWKINKKEFLSLLNEFPDIKAEVESLVKVKELYRVSMQAATTPQVRAKFEVSHLHESITGEHLYGSSKIHNALTQKMLKKIHKGNYFDSAQNKNDYESLDFEPDLSSPLQVFNRFAGSSDDEDKKDKKVSPLSRLQNSATSKRSSSLTELEKVNSAKKRAEAVKLTRKSFSDARLRVYTAKAPPKEAKKISDSMRDKLSGKEETLR